MASRRMSTTILIWRAKCNWNIRETKTIMIWMVHELNATFSRRWKSIYRFWRSVVDCCSCRRRSVGETEKVERRDSAILLLCDEEKTKTHFALSLNVSTVFVSFLFFYLTSITQFTCKKQIISSVEEEKCDFSSAVWIIWKWKMKEKKKKKNWTKIAFTTEQ